VKDADYCEHRINAFLEDKFQEFDPSEEQVETIKNSIINTLKQKRTSLGSECNFNKLELKKLRFTFDSDL
jgi:secreted Zn-dependent insulinase-like peptidase